MRVPDAFGNLTGNAFVAVATADGDIGILNGSMGGVESLCTLAGGAAATFESLFAGSRVADGALGCSQPPANKDAPTASVSRGITRFGIASGGLLRKSMVPASSCSMRKQSECGLDIRTSASASSGVISASATTCLSQNAQWRRFSVPVIEFQSSEQGSVMARWRCRIRNVTVP